MTAPKNYKKTLIACYLGFVTQAITVNFPPLLFLTFKNTYQIGLEKIALIPVIFFFTQLLVDFLATKYLDRIGYRVCAVASQVLSSLGLIFMSVLPEVFSAPLVGILIAVVFYAIGCGLLEVLASPMVEACPFENKDGVMSLLHSFYCWGAVGVILGSTLFFSVFGVENWKILAVIWAFLPLYNAFNFISCPIERLVEEGEGIGAGHLFRFPLFWLYILLMVCAGASEAAMAQWASAFTEAAMGVSKTVGDLAGPCSFAAFMGIARVFYGKMSRRLDLKRTMLVSGVLCVICYFLAALSSLPVIGLAGCAFCGISVGIMWPGTISISAQSYPKGGTAMFAFLALAGDLGSTVSPAMVGAAANLVGGDLKTGLLAATLFPCIMIIGLFILNRKFCPVVKKESGETD